MTVITLMKMHSSNSVLFSVELVETRKRLKNHPTEPLTRTEKDVLLGFKRAIREHGTPSLRQIAQSSGPSYYASNIRKYLRRLEEKGYVRWPKGSKPQLRSRNGKGGKP